jgi:hypothetical protein
MEVCRILKKQIKINLESGIGCKYWAKRHCIFCFWHVGSWKGEKELCPKEPVNSCAYYLGA